MARIGRAALPSHIVRPIRHNEEVLGRTSVYLRTSWGTSLPADFTVGGDANGSSTGVDTSRLKLNTGSNGSYLDWARAEVTDAATTSLADFDIYTAWDWTNPRAEQYVNVLARCSNDWSAGVDEPATYIGALLDYNGRAYIKFRASAGTRTYVASNEKVLYIPVTNGGRVWNRFRGRGPYVWSKWWVGLISDEPVDWSLFATQDKVLGAGRVKWANTGGNAAAIKECYIAYVDIGNTTVSADINTTCLISAGAGLGASSATGDRTASSLIAVGEAAWSTSPVQVGLSSLVAAGARVADGQLQVGLSSLIAAGANVAGSPLGVGLFSLIEAGSALWAPATPNRTASALIEAGSAVQAGSYGVGLSALIEVGAAVFAPIPYNLNVTAMISAGSGVGMGTMGVGLGSIVPAGANVRDGRIDLLMNSLIEAGSGVGASPVGVGLSSLVAAGAATWAPATGDRAATAAIRAGSAAWLAGPWQVGLSGLIEAGSGAGAGAFGVGLPSFISAGARLGLGTLGVGLSGLVGAGAAASSGYTISVSWTSLVEVGAAVYMGAPALSFRIYSGAAMYCAAYTIQANTSGLISAGANVRASAATPNLTAGATVSAGALLDALVSRTVNVQSVIPAGGGAQALTIADLQASAAIRAGGAFGGPATRDTAPVSGFVGAGGSLQATPLVQRTTSGLIVVGADVIAGAVTIVTVVHRIAPDPIVAQDDRRPIVVATDSPGLVIVADRPDSLIIAHDSRSEVIRGT